MSTLTTAVSSIILSLGFMSLSPISHAGPVDTLEQLMIDAGYSKINLEKLKTGHETVQVSLNGQTGTFILDSGAGASVIHDAFAQKYGLNLLSSEKTGTGAGGQLAVSQSVIDGLTIGEVELAWQTVHVMDLSHVVDAIARVNAIEADGIIGQDILTAFGGVIDIRGARLFLKTEPGIESRPTE